MKPVTGGEGLEALLLGNSSLEAKENGRSTREGVFEGAKPGGSLNPASPIEGFVFIGRKVVICGPGGVGGGFCDELKLLITTSLRLLFPGGEDLDRGGGVRTKEGGITLDTKELESLGGRD